MKGIRMLLLLALPLGTAGAAALPPGQDPELEQAPASAEAEATLLALGELDTRLTVPVAVGNAGPYPFVIDTGAERTVLSRELAGRLQLAAGAPINLMSMSGSAMVDTVIVPNLTIGSIDERHALTAPALEARNLGAAGLLGIDTLRASKVTIDFVTGQMSVQKSEKRQARRRNRDEVVVTAKSQFGALIVTNAYYGDTQVQVVLDTGSQVTMGNSALRERIGRKMPITKSIEITSVIGRKTPADYAKVPDMRIGGIRFQSLPIAFADVTPFERFGLTKRPAILLGMDALRSFLRVEIDFPNRQVRFLMPRTKVRDMPRSTSSLIPGVEGASPSRNY